MVFESAVSHIGLNVSNFNKSKAFYEELMQILGREKCLDIPDIYCGWAGFSFGIQGTAEERVSKNVHVAFVAKSKEQVDAFYDKALSLGATCNGKPGVRPEYSSVAEYYAAFVHDLEGNNIEAVFMQ
ncbi:lactoylglutathione lyase [Hesseltinella vesiculosa]|uniref:Lactoylglutathione lyase n=1 Tax=Hesseltinella vesiculosa TaxID=101127 RepID=A0A1X2GC75_9FUNG|nr:lactoylglutathione lyase [Hesseltinella vesiculosa]